MATPGDIQEKYRRTYVCVNPDAALGPPTWRLAVSQETGSGGGGGTGNQIFEGTAPVDVNTTTGDAGTTVTTSIDISQLTDRAQ